MTPRQRIERLRSKMEDEIGPISGADAAALLTLLDEWEKILIDIRHGRDRQSATDALALLDKESR